MPIIRQESSCDTLSRKKETIMDGNNRIIAA